VEDLTYRTPSEISTPTGVLPSACSGVLKSEKYARNPENPRIAKRKRERFIRVGIRRITYGSISFSRPLYKSLPLAILLERVFVITQEPFVFENSARFPVSIQ
jgi:hypothetical protein